MFGTVEGFRAYASERGNPTPNETPVAEVEQALLRASDYIDVFYVSRFTEAFETPPQRVVDATYEAAILELQTPFFFSRTYTPAETKVLTEVSGIKWTLTGKAGGADAFTPVSAKIERMLFGYRRPRVGVFVV